MKPKVYVETTVVSYLTGYPSRDLVVAGHQRITREWWESCRDSFELVASELVAGEAGEGDSEAARLRRDLVNQLTLLETTAEALNLARQLVRSRAVPENAPEDALHIAVAVTNGIEYLVTWNCRHLANATMRARIDGVCRAAGYEPTIICTPEELLESGRDVG